MKPGCTLIAYLHAKPEKRDELLKVLHSFVKPSRAEPACVDYHLHVSNDDPNLFVFYENWRTRKELDEHLQTPILTSVPLASEDSQIGVRMRVCRYGQDRAHPSCS
jgi:quinol monooxygenase YgiN